MSIKIKTYDDIKKHTILLEPSKFDFVAFWNFDLEDWDMRAKVRGLGEADEGNLEFFDVRRSKKYKVPKMDDPGWEHYNILACIYYPNKDSVDFELEWRIFKENLNLQKLKSKDIVLDLKNVLFGIDNPNHKGIHYSTPVVVHSGFKGMVSTDTLGTFKDFMEEL